MLKIIQLLKTQDPFILMHSFAIHSAATYTSHRLVDVEVYTAVHKFGVSRFF